MNKNTNENKNESYGVGYISHNYCRCAYNANEDHCVKNICSLYFNFTIDHQNPSRIHLHSHELTSHQQTIVQNNLRPINMAWSFIYLTQPKFNINPINYNRDAPVF